MSLQKKSLNKYLNIVVVIIFVNFMALPSIATLCDFEIPTTNVVLSEEENHGSVNLVEKNVPRTLNIHDFIKFFHSQNQERYLQISDDLGKNPHLQIFSPPPEA